MKKELPFYLKYLPEILTLGTWLLSLHFILSADSSLRKFIAKGMAVYLVGWGLFFLLSKVTRSEKALRFIIVTVTLGVLMGSLEALTYFKILDYRTVFSTPIFAPWRKPTNILDPELIYIHKPNDHYKGTTKGTITWLFDVPDAQEYDYEIQYDKNGFRNRENFDQADIAVIGDSFLEGAKVAFSSLVTSHLAERLDKRVVNFGLIGYGPYQYNILLKRYALPLQPDFAIWTFYEGNDLKNIFDYEETISNWKKSVNTYHSFKDRSFLKNFYLAIGRIFKKNELRSAEDRAFSIRTKDGGMKKSYFMHPGEPLTEKEMRALQRVDSLLQEAYRICKENDIELIVVFIPTKVRVYKDIAEIEPEYASKWIVNDLPERLKSVVASISSEIGYIDLTFAFRQAAKAGIVPYFLDDTHWTPVGHKIAAEEIAEHINEYIDRPVRISESISKRN